MNRPPVRGDEPRRPRHAAPDDAGDGYDDDLAPHEGHETDDRYEDHEAYEEYDDDEGDADDGWYDPDVEGGYSSDWDDDEYEYEDAPREGGRASRLLLLLGIFAAVVVLTFGGLFVYVRSQLDPGGEVGAEVRFTVPSGSSVNSVAGLLADEGIIEDAQMFRWYMRWKGVEGFLAGDYILNENMAAWDVVEVLQGDPLPVDSVAFTVPEGLMVSEIPAAINSSLPTFDPAVLQELIESGTIRPSSLDPAVTSLEGFLFPDTYELLAGQGEDAALQRMADQFDAVATEIDLAGRAAALGRTPYEIVVIASLIQEEYGIPEEMGRISRVIYNRLEIGEPLGIDATSRYEAILAGRDREDLDFESESPYNTRINPGLPPTPIAAPGRLALEAALSPEPGPWIFYVRDPNTERTPEGGHFFTDSAAEFSEVKAECEAAGLGCG
jgi:UPF0755 protein